MAKNNITNSALVSSLMPNPLIKKITLETSSQFISQPLGNFDKEAGYYPFASEQWKALNSNPHIDIVHSILQDIFVQILLRYCIYIF